MAQIGGVCHSHVSGTESGSGWSGWLRKSQLIPEALGQGLAGRLAKSRQGPVPNDLSVHLAGPPATGGLQRRLFQCPPRGSVLVLLGWERTGRDCSVGTRKGSWGHGWKTARTE